jgi:dolichol-phosphate mannosyltransferase
VPAGAAFLTVLISYLFAARILGRGAAFCGALVLTLSVGFIFCGRFLVLDSVLSLFVTAALCSAHLALEGDRLRPGWWIASAVCCGLGVLTKGPIACVLFAPPVLAHAWLSGSRVRPTRRQWLAFGGLVTLVAAPWFLAIMLRDPNFARYFFWEHHVSRFAGAFHARPVWFFIPVLLAGGLPWSLLAIPFCRFLCSRAPELRALRPRQLGFLVLWAGWNFCFFSASKCKLPPYILPAAPALALLLGYFLDRVVLTVPLQLKFFRGLGELPRHASGTLCVTGIVLSPVAYFLGMTHLTGALFYACFWAICLAGVRAYARQLSVQAAWALCGLLAYVTICDTTQRLVPAWAEQQNLLAARGPVTQLLADEQTAVVSYLREWSAVPFYLERNDIRNFTNYEIPALSEFLTAHPRTVMLMKPTLDPEKLGIVLPAGSRMSRIVETPQAALVLVEVPAGAAAPAKLTGN